ncbi:MAG TPA: hypothetical protein VH165_08880 [Kofleriaceae bacterium]|jgi:hypothetical protein|nr:hypothetical protein [Kofleriaceae bacterium]
MKRQPRLSRSQAIVRLREHAAHVGAVSVGSLDEHDRIALHSLRLYFPSFEAACRVAEVELAKPRQGGRDRPQMPNAVWSKDRVVQQLRALDRDGQSTKWGDLIAAGHGNLVGAAVTYAGGLQAARAEAGVSEAVRRAPVQWDRALIMRTIQDRARDQESLASSKAPPHFVAAARWHFGSWAAALAAAGIDAGAVRLQRAPFTRDEILAVIQRQAQGGTIVRPATLKRELKLDTVRKLFGSVRAAIAAAGVVQDARHPSQKWSRERVIEELQARAARGERTLTRALHHAVQRYFGGVHAARAAAGLPALLRTAWTRPMMIAELQARARFGRKGVGRLLRQPAIRLFGSIEAALADAARAEPWRSTRQPEVGRMSSDEPMQL